MDSNHKKWPNSWDYHISQYCNFYFHNKDIEYLDKKIWTEASINKPETKVSVMNLKFRIGDHQYLVNLKHNDDSHFSCSVFYRKPFKNSSDPTALHISCCNGKDIFLLDDIASMGGHNMTINEIMEFAEQMMWEDYQRRKGNNWDNDDDDDDDDKENDPIEPFSPTEVVELELTYV